MRVRLHVHLALLRLLWTRNFECWGARIENDICTAPGCPGLRRLSTRLNLALYSLQVVASRTLLVASCTLLSASRGQRYPPVLLAS